MTTPGTVYAVLPLPPLTTWPDPCGPCRGAGVTGEAWEMPGDVGRPVLLAHELCPDCGGCGNGDPDHAGCTAIMHAWPEDHDQGDDDDEDKHDDEDAPECPSCGPGARGWNAVQGFLHGDEGTVEVITRVPCGCSEPRLVTGTDPGELAELREPGGPAAREACLRLAAEALQAAMREDWPAVTVAVKRISDEHGGGGLTLAIVGWCDTLAAKHPALKGTGPDNLRGVAWTEAERGGVQFADDVPPETRWAGQVVMARVNLDEAAFYALLEALPHDGWKIGDYIAALLQSIALTLGRIRDSGGAEAAR